MTRIGMVYYKKTILIVLLSMYSIFACSSDVAGFGEICKIYTEAKNSSMAMSKKELSHYIFENIKNRVSSKDALSVHDAVFGLAPSKRYALVKEAAEYYLKHTWDCKAMKEILK